MNTIRARYEVGIEDTSLEHFRLWSDASMRASAISGYVYDRMARVGKPQLWQAVNGDLIVQSVRLLTKRAPDRGRSRLNSITLNNFVVLRSRPCR